MADAYVPALRVRCRSAPAMCWSWLRRATAARCRCWRGPPRSLGLDVDDLVAAEAVALITVRDARVEFRHPLVRSAVYGDAPAAQRRAAHRSLADALPDSEADQPCLASCAGRVRPRRRRRLVALEQAGQRARSRSAYEVSVSGIRARAPCWPRRKHARGWLLYAAADAAWLGGLADRAEALLSRARKDAAGDEPAPSRSSSCAGTSRPAADRSARHSRSCWPPPSWPRRSTRSARS